MSRPDDWFNQVCAALGLFDGARPVSTSEVLREEVLPAIQALKENNPEAAILIEENVRLQRLWRDALAMAVANKRKEGRMTERIERGQWMAWRGIETAPTNTSVLVFIPNAEHYGPGVYRAILVDMGTGRRWMTTGLHCGRDVGGDQQPTYWMPLPEAQEVGA